jgi:hypothetical protein
MTHSERQNATHILIRDWMDANGLEATAPAIEALTGLICEIWEIPDERVREVAHEIKRLRAELRRLLSVTPWEHIEAPHSDCYNMLVPGYVANRWRKLLEGSKAND